MRMHWVVLANEANARIFSGGELLDDLVEIRDLIHPEGRMNDRDLKSDRAGRYMARDGSRTAADPQTEPEAVEATRFARQLAEILRVGRNERAYERVILVAPPKFLGRLRAELDDGVARMVVGEIGKDLTKHPAGSLPDALRRGLPPTAGLHA